LERVQKLLAEGQRLAGMPPALAAIVAEEDASLADYLELDDAVVWTALAAWRRASDPILRDLSERLHARRLFKTYELHDEQLAPEARQHALQRARGIATEAGLDPEVYVGLDVASDLPFDDSEKPLAVLFPGGKERKPGDVSYLLGRLRGARYERVRLIFAPQLREPIERALEP